MRGADLLGASMREELYERAARAIERTAYREDGCANWLAIASTAPWDGKQLPFLVQWCHGSPGTLGAISAFPRNRNPEMELLFIAGGELTWQAGPLTKGPGVCHGTGGNAYLFLKLYKRTGDAKWLDRARAFAMHGIAQYRRFKAEYRRGWYSLWTGDLGFAVFLWHCIIEDDAFPTMDVF